MKQFVLPGNPESHSLELKLNGRDHHYLIHVRRYNPGDSIPAMSPDGRTFRMEILKVDLDYCTVGLTPTVRSPEQDLESLPRITLIPAVTRGKKMDLTVRQAVEAGALAIWPVLTERCQVRYRDPAETNAKKIRWERIAVEALQQCGGRVATELAAPGKLGEILEAWGEKGPLLYLHEQEISEEDAGSLHRHLAEPVGELAIMVGPEGGFSASEIRLLREKGGHPIYLGSRVLRAETAAIYGLAAVITIIRERTRWQPV